MVFLLLLGCYGLFLNAQIKEKQVPYLIKSLTHEAIKNVEVETSGGNISVMGGNASEARIEVYVNQNNNKSGNTVSKEEIQKRLDEDYILIVSVLNNKAIATAKPKERSLDWERSLNISFKVYVTSNVSTELKTSGGNISLKNLSGNQNFQTSGGNLSVDSISGKVNGITFGGNIHVSNSKDEIEMKTSGGSINAQSCAGNLNLSTSGGSLNLVALKGKINANTNGGSIKGRDIEGELSTNTFGGSIQLSDLSCSLETLTGGGHTEVSIKKLGDYVRITSGGGDIDLQLPINKGVDLKLLGRIKTSNLNNFSGDKDDDELAGKVSGGGIPVTVTAASGRINLSFE